MADPKKYTNTPHQENLFTPRGGAVGKMTQFEDKKYDIKNYSYPSDLMSENYGGNYVVFYINVAKESKLFKDKSVEIVEDFPARDRGEAIAMGFSRTGLVASNAAVNTIMGALGGTIGFGGGAAGALKGAAIANIPTVGVGVAATQAPDAVRGQKRLKTAIALHVPNQLQIRYNVQYSEDDMQSLAMVGAAGEQIAKAVTTLGKNSNVVGTTAAIISSLALSKGPNAAANSALLGLASNPKKEQVFKSVDFRTFNFEYQFFPRDVTEAENVMRIIQEFKYHMHPEFKDKYNFLYIYPSEFDVFYYQGSMENKHIHRHTSCVLQEMSVNYTPNGLFTTFDNGMPTQINVVLNFRELALLSKEKIKDGL